MRKIKSFYNLNALTTFTSLLLSVTGIAFSATNATTGLKDAAAKAYLNIGVATDRPSSYSSIVTPEYNILVCENAMKWDATEKTQGTFSFGTGDGVLSFATTNGMKMRGHCCVWHSQTPSWVQSLNRQDMLTAMKNHITGVLTHYKGKILEWDVVNEAVSAGSSSFWQKTIGTGFIDSAFIYAHQADPGAYLYYNDYGGESTGGKGDQIYNMVKTMLQNKIPIHGVGLQCHFGSVNKATISANIKRLGDLGLRVSCTEIDIQNTSTNGTPWTDLMNACLENFNATTFVVWGVDDAVSWRGSNCGCTIFDGSQKAKPAVYDALMTALNGADPTIAEKRKTFAGLTPSAILEGKGKPAALNAIYKATSRFAFKNNVVAYFLPSEQNLRIQVMDLRGKMAADLNLGMQTSGNHSVQWTHGQLPAGLYFAKIKTVDQSRVIPFTILDRAAAYNSGDLPTK